MGKLESIPGKSQDPAWFHYNDHFKKQNKTEREEDVHTHTHIQCTHIHMHTHMHTITHAHRCGHTHIHICMHTHPLLPHPFIFFSILFCPEIVFLHVFPHLLLTLPLECKLYEDRDLVSLAFFF